MAFTTEFVMGAGGAEVEEIPVSMSGGGNGTVYPLTTIDAGDGAMVTVTGTFSDSGGTVSNSSTRPHLKIGSGFTHDYPHAAFSSGTGGAVVAVVSGPVTVSILTRAAFGTTTFSGTVYVARV